MKTPMWWYWYRLKQKHLLSSEWLIFENFHKWLKDNGYDHKRYTLKVKNKAYRLGPQNCEIVLRKKYVIVDCKVKSLKELAHQSGVGEDVIRRRLGLGYTAKTATKSKVQTWFKDKL